MHNIEYARIVVTDKCNLRCQYCHKEGIKSKTTGITAERYCSIMEGLHKCGIRKFKFLGGEPTLYPHICKLIRFAKGLDSENDVSMVSNGLFSIDLIQQCFEAGLDRINISIHSWGDAQTINLSGMTANELARLKNNLEYLTNIRKLTKVNYVYLKTKDKSELHDLIEWCGKKQIVIDLLNLLMNETTESSLVGDFETMENMESYIRSMYSITNEFVYNNRYSISSKRLVLDNGCTINLKTNRLNQINVFHCCENCNEKKYCTEGIAAIRVTQEGNIQPCLLRTDNCLSLDEIPEQLLPEKISEYLSLL